MRLLIIFLLTAFTGTLVLAQSPAKGIFAQIGKNKVSKLTDKMAAEVNFCINDEQSSISKAEAASQLSAFLTDIGVKSCRPAHTGDSTEKGSYFRVGKIKAAKGKYRLFLYFENNEVVEIRIDTY